MHAPEVLAGLVARAEASKLVLTSLMVKLRCESFAERSLIPAFIFFFQMLYPFAWVNKPTQRDGRGGRRLHAGAQRRARKAAGGIEAIRGALIDDCALAKVLKAQGPIWLGLTERVHSIRPYPDVRRHPPHGLALGLCAVALFAAAARRHRGRHGTHLSRPPLLALFASGAARWLGMLAWGLMAVAFQPTLRFYRLSLLWGLALPAIALCYMLFTLDSAYQYARGQGGIWKGRVQANVGTMTTILPNCDRARGTGTRISRWRRG